MKVIIIHENEFASFVENVMQDIDFDSYSAEDVDLRKLLGLSVENYIDMTYQEDILINPDCSEPQNIILSAYEVDYDYPFSLEEDGTINVDLDSLTTRLKWNKELQGELIEALIDKIFNSIDNYPFIFAEMVM